jgi:hypothetical protein
VVGELVELEPTHATPLSVYVYEVAPVPPVQLIVKDVGLIAEEDVITGCDGGIGGAAVVTLNGTEAVNVEFEDFTAVTMTVYSLDATKPVNVVGELVELEPTHATPLSVYVYEVAPEPPVQLIVKDVGLIAEEDVITGCVGGGGSLRKCFIPHDKYQVVHSK